MSVSAEQLQAFLGQLGDQELKTLAAKIELDRGENKFGIPHDAIMALLRPRLAEIRAPRIFTPQRILCVPFEDMLTFTDPDTKETGKIARAAIMPMWTLLMERLGDRWEPVADAFVRAQKKGDEAALKAAASQIWSMASKELKEWDAGLGKDAGEIRAAAKKIGGTRRLEDFREMASVLAIADIIESMKEKLPRKPILTFTPEHVTIIKRHYDRVGKEAPEHELYLLLALIGRLLQPFPVLKVFRALTRKLDDTLTSKTDLGIAGGIVIQALESDADAVAEAAESPGATEDDVMAKVRRFANAFKGITSDIGIRRDGEWGQRMYGCRGRVSKAVEHLVLNTAQETILSAFPHGGRRAADFSAFPDDDKFEIAERRARALGEASRMAEQIGLQSACQSKVNQLRKDLEQYGAKIIEKLPKTPVDKKAEAAAHLATTVRLVELVTNSDTADLLRRRGNAALSGKMLD
jgi:hypothetical protein